MHLSLRSVFPNENRPAVCLHEPVCSCEVDESSKRAVFDCAPILISPGPAVPLTWAAVEIPRAPLAIGG